MLLRDGRPVPLPPKVFDTLLALVENCGHLLEKDRLITMLWPNTFVEEATLARNISDLRKALGETSEHEYIETVPERGYRFVAAVSNVSDDALIVERTRSRIVTEEDEQPLSQATPDSVQSPVVAPQTAAAPARIRRGKLGVTAAVTLGAIVVLIALWFLLPRPGSKSKGTTVPLKNVSFTQLTDQPGPEYFPSLSPDGKSLIYASRISGNWDIYLQRVGGRNPTNLTRDSPADDTQPAFSPNSPQELWASGCPYEFGAFRLDAAERHFER
jgi:DNA-binding winged helix-turn-helix (wHTH) protein